jgi:hypothetical protein
MAVPFAGVPSGLHDDSREADEQQRTPHLADLRGRVKAARGSPLTTTGRRGGPLARDWVREAHFYAQHLTRRTGVTTLQGLPDRPTPA